MTDLYDANSFGEFWVRYREAHSRRGTRALHVVATTAAIGLLTLAVRRRSLGLAIAAPIVDYAIAQMAHRFIEGNTTQPYRHPWWHLRGEWRLYRESLRFS